VEQPRFAEFVARPDQLQLTSKFRDTRSTRGHSGPPLSPDVFCDVCDSNNAVEKREQWFLTFPNPRTAIPNDIGLGQGSHTQIAPRAK